MKDADFSVRRIEEADRVRWRELFDAYTRFYEREPDDAIAAHTWRRIMDPASPVHAIVAERRGQGVAGIANYLTHESTGALAPVCYLQDLFVDPRMRAAGAGGLMIDWLLEEGRREGWARLYWTTKENNYRARALYDRYTPHSGFLRYALDLRK
ncbi:MAG: N-acetyltransferase family protein [Usitatibacter sp.]